LINNNNNNNKKSPPVSVLRQGLGPGGNLSGRGERVTFYVDCGLCMRVYSK